MLAVGVAGLAAFAAGMGLAFTPKGGGVQVIPPRQPPTAVPCDYIGQVDGKLGGLADLRPGSVLTYARLRRAQWRGVDLRGVTLSGADLRDANLRGADLRLARLWDGCLLYGADLRGADLRGTDLWGVFPDMSTDYRGATYDTHTRWPAGFDPRAHEARLVDDEGRLVSAGGNQGEATRWVGVAVLGPTDHRAAERARTVLNAGGISPLLMSNLGIHVQVPEPDRERALALLERDAPQHGYRIRWLR
jgi:hypothetical protein